MQPLQRLCYRPLLAKWAGLRCHSLIFSLQFDSCTCDNTSLSRSSRRAAASQKMRNYLFAFFCAPLNLHELVRFLRNAFNEKQQQYNSKRLQ